jgi:hypothetical protein
MQPDKTFEGWLPFDLAVKYVERHRGWSYGKAAKALDDACATDQVTNKVQPRYPEPDDGPDAPDQEHVVWNPDLWRWLSPTKTPVKRAKIKAWLAKKFSDQRVPDDYVRIDLLGELRGADPLLVQVDDATVKTAIDEYNAERNTK